jgi:protein TonB
MQAHPAAPIHAPRLNRPLFDERRLGLALAVALHVLAVWGLLQIGAVRQSLLDAAPIMVHLIDPPPSVTPPKPLPVAPKPQPARTTPIEPSVLATPPTPTPQAAAPVAPPQIEPAPISVPAPAPPPVTAPIFNAAYLRNPPPDYPAQSKRRNESGKVYLRVYVSADGAAEKVELHTSSGWPRLDQAAGDAVRNWRFVPAKQGDQAVPAWVIVPINFNLEG